MWLPSARYTGTLLQSLGHYSPLGTGLGASVMGKWQCDGILGRLPAFPAVSPPLSSASLNTSLSPCGLPMTPCGTVVSFQDLPRDTQAPCSKAETLQPVQYCPGGFWDWRGHPGRLPSFPAVSLLLSSACLKVPLSPCNLHMPSCGPVFCIWWLSTRHTGSLLQSL